MILKKVCSRILFIYTFLELSAWILLLDWIFSKGLFIQFILKSQLLHITAQQWIFFLICFSPICFFSSAICQKCQRIYKMFVCVFLDECPGHLKCKLHNNLNANLIVKSMKFNETLQLKQKLWNTNLYRLNDMWHIINQDKMAIHVGLHCQFFLLIIHLYSYLNHSVITITSLHHISPASMCC